MTRGRLRRRLAVACARGNDRGASAVELAILAPALIFVSLLIVQFAIWFDARHAALAAAQQGDLVARENAATNPGGWQPLAQNAATTNSTAIEPRSFLSLRTRALSRMRSPGWPGCGSTRSGRSPSR